MNTLTLVRNKGLIYPRHDEDFEALRQLKVPINTLTIDFLPVLVSLCALKKVKVQTVQFDHLESAMLAKVAERWPHAVVCTPKMVSTTFPRTTKLAKAESLMQAMRSWYASHHYTTSVQTTRKKQSLTVQLLKTQSTE